MTEHDPRCKGGSDVDQKLLADIAQYGWHVMRVLETPQTPGWAYSIGLYKNFGHPEILVFGLDLELMHFMINTIGEGAQQGKHFESDQKYADLIETYLCTLREVKRKWYSTFLGFADWYYAGTHYPVLQCFWPDFESHYPWDPEFDQQLLWAQPQLFHNDRIAANVTTLIESLDLNVSD